MITVWTVILFALALSADAFAVSLCEGMRQSGAETRHALKVAAYFGFFQALMPTFGYFIANILEKIPVFDRLLSWIAFGLLFLIALKMLWDALHEEQIAEERARAAHGELILLAIATSIDAMGAGITFGASGVKGFRIFKYLFSAAAERKTWESLVSFVFIGLVTFTLSFLGVKLGDAAGKKLGHTAQIVGAVILFFLSVKFLLEIFGLKIGI